MRLSLYLILLSFINISQPPDTSRELQIAQCPVVVITCPDSLSLKKPSSITASLLRADANLKLVYQWTVFNGEIIEGQGTQSIKIRSFGNSLTTIVKVEGLGPNCNDMSSCSIYIDSRPPNRLFDRYVPLHFKDEKARLSNFANELRKEPGSQGYIIIYAGRDDKSVRANRTKDYLIKEQGIDARRVVIIEGGTRKERAIELYIVPPGAMPPTVTPTVSPGEVQDN